MNGATIKGSTRPSPPPREQQMDQIVNLAMFRPTMDRTVTQSRKFAVRGVNASITLGGGIPCRPKLSLLNQNRHSHRLTSRPNREKVKFGGFLNKCAQISTTE